MARPPTHSTTTATKAAAPPPGLFSNGPAAVQPAPPKPADPTSSNEVKCGNVNRALGICCRNEHPPDEMHQCTGGERWTTEQAAALDAPQKSPAEAVPVAAVQDAKTRVIQVNPNLTPEEVAHRAAELAARVADDEEHSRLITAGRAALAAEAAGKVAAQPVPAPAPAPPPPAVPAKPAPVPLKPAVPPVRAAAPANPQQQPARSPIQQARMVVPGQRLKPVDAPVRGFRFFLWGEKKIGKTEFVVDAEDVAFIPAETSPNVPEERCFAQPEKWSDIQDGIRAFLDQPGAFRGLCIDTGDAANALLVTYIKEKAVGGAGSSKGQIKFASDIGGGYKSDEKALVEEWTVLLALLDRVRDRGFNVFILGHSGIGKQTNPDGTDYMIWNPRMPEPVAALITGWADIVGFAQKEVTVEKVSKFRAKGASTGAHMLHLQSTKATFFAGNRYNLPAKLPLSYVAFAAAMQKRSMSETAEMLASIEEKLATIPEEFVIQTLRNGAAVEVKVVEWTRATIAENQALLTTHWSEAAAKKFVGLLAKLDSRLRAITDELAASREPAAEGDEQQQ